jgi:hypothetical protein
MQVDLVCVSGWQIRMVLYSRHLFIRYITAVFEKCVQILVRPDQNRRDHSGNIGIHGANLEY